MLKVAGEETLKELICIINKLLGDNTPDDWKNSITIPVFEGQGDVMKYGNDGGVRLLEHSMKLYEQILEKRVRNMVEIDNYQFSFYPGRPTTVQYF